MIWVIYLNYTDALYRVDCIEDGETITLYGGYEAVQVFTTFANYKKAKKELDEDGYDQV